MASSYSISSGTGRIKISSSIETYLAVQLSASSLDADVTYKLQHSSDGANFIDIPSTSGTLVSASDSALVETYDYTLVDCYLYIDVGSATTGTVNVFSSSKKKEAQELINKRSRYTPFGEEVVANRTSFLNFKPTWGVSELRYDTTTTGTGAAVGETGGEFQLQTGTSTSSVARIQTKKRGQYHAGTQGEIGVAARIPTAPTSTQVFEWGYYDTENGLGWGYDSTGVYCFHTSNSTQTKIYQSSWNIDSLSSLDMTDGNIFHIEFTWYGYGDIEYYIIQTVGNIEKRVLVHREIIDGSVSVQDPNQPLRFYATNGATSTDNKSLYIGGHQYSIVDGFSDYETRPVSTILADYTTATNTNWQPLIAVRKKSTFNSRNNSVLTTVTGFQVSSDSDIQARLTINGVTSNLSWTAPIGWTSTETSCEVKTTGGTALTASTDGEPVKYIFLTTSKNAGGTDFVRRQEIDLGEDNEVILWVRRYSASGTVKVLGASIAWEEEW